MAAVPGYRLFFPGACLVAALWLPVWLASAFGGLSVLVPFGGPLWHTHEMVFGFVPAMFAGFLTLTRSGVGVLASFALWLAGRLVLMAPASLPAAVVVPIDVAFMPVLGAQILPQLRRSGGRFIPAVTVICIVVLTLLNLWSHWGGRGWVPGGAIRPLYAGAIVDAAVMTALGGRLLRTYLRAFLQHSGTKVRGAEVTGLIVAVVALLAWLLEAEAVAGAALIALGLIQLIRLARWWDRRISNEPLLSSITAGFLWLALSLLLWGSGHLSGAMGPSAGLNLMLIGAFGPVAGGMAVRLTRARCGRTASAGTWPVLAFWLLTMAGLLATAWFLAPVGSMHGNALYVLAVVAGAWSLAYLILGVVLILDGRPVARRAA